MTDELLGTPTPRHPNTPTPNHPATSVLIVGAGPTGLTLAIELARRGIAYRLIDRDAARAPTSRAIGTQARTVEVFHLMGIPQSALQPAVWPRALRLAERERTLARLPFGSGPGASPRLLSMDESDTERVLEERLVGLGGRVEWNTELTTFRLDGDRVVASVNGPAGPSEIEAQFLVGADGAHSVVRRGAGIAFAGAAYPERFLLTDMDIEWELSHEEGHVWIGDDGLVAAIPLPGDRHFRLIVPLPPAESATEYPTESAIATRAEALLRQRTGLPLRRVGEPAWASAFHIQRRQAAHYRQGPIFIAGDAAHVHSPVGGQGMNMGIQDAFNLGWKLALAAQGLAAPGLLDTYEAERHPVGRGVLRGTHLATRVFLARNPIMHVVREQIVPALITMPPVRRRALATISQLTVAYRDSPLASNADEPDDVRDWLHRAAPGIRAGDRVPDAALTDAATGARVSLFDLVARGWTLLLFPSAKATPERLAQVEGLAGQTREMVGDAVQPYVVLNAPSEIALTTPILVDGSGAAGRIVGASRGLAALVRPDGYLGYRGRPDQPGALASYLARIFAMRMRGVADGGDGVR